MTNNALLLIDLQNDYLWEKRKTKFSYVGETAKWSIKAGFKTKIVKNAIASRYSKDKIKKMRNELTSLGVEYI